MTTVERTRLDQCATKDCPWRDDWDFHQIPWCQGIRVVGVGGVALGHPLPVTHQHWPKRSQGGKEIVALLCFMCHDRIDNRDWGNAVKEINGKRVYMIWDLHGEILYERVLGVGATGEGEASASASRQRGVKMAETAPPALPSPAAPAPSDGEEGVRRERGDSACETPLSPSPGAPEQAGRDSRDAFSDGADSPVTPPSFSTQEDRNAGNSDGERLLESEVRDGASRAPSGDEGALEGLDGRSGIRARRDSRDSDSLANRVAPYTFGDNGIEWEPEFTLDDWARAAERVKTESVGRQWRVGDLVNAERWAECSQFFDELGYPPETQANYGRVSAAYKLAERRPLSFAHHQAVYKHKYRLHLLDGALAEGWTVKELREQAGYGPRIQIRRFTIEYLREDLAGYENRALRNNGRKFAAAWLESLEEQA